MSKQGQTRLGSLVESLANTASGFIVSLLVWMLLVTPAFSIESNFSQDFAITCIFTVTSVIRSYLWRRFFNGSSMFQNVDS